ncbi:hypothetical protein LOZ53_005577 [Ophidiomyces ophidiicola]|nr:hypothetical protein LOZ55_006290 [Ophidiomyces ophidiicola]KAI1984118.1 hypothetical protein LOZ53_005577 [Ophidiomyces ophidiicola]KAI1987812.1 hypothetical protein LOZ54_003407 [Ophidiomyces ophidiicola]
MDSAPQGQVDEHSRLLGRPVGTHRSDPFINGILTWWQTWRVAILCYIVAWLADCGETMRQTPKTRMIESIICRRYYQDRGSDGTSLGAFSSQLLALEIDESLCKVHAIQAELAMTKAWLKIGENLLTLVLAIPFGHLANRKGRNFVLTLGMVGQMMSEAWIIIACFLSNQLPFELIYFSVFLKSAGGGAMVLSALVHAILSDVMSRDRQGQAFFYLASSSLLTEVIAPPLGSILMEAGSPYTPLLSGFPLELLSLIFIVQIPNTAKHEEEHLVSAASPSARIYSEESDFETRAVNTSITREDRDITGSETKQRGLVNQLILVWEMMTRNSDILRITVAFLVTTLARETLDFVVQYTSERFGWSLSKVGSFSFVPHSALFFLIEMDD